MFLIESLLSDGEWHSLADFAVEVDCSTRKVTRLLRQFKVERKLVLDKRYKPVRWVKQL